MPETKISGKVKLGRCASNLWRVSFTFKGVKHVIVVSVLIFLTPTFLGSGPLGSRHSVSTYLDSFDIGEWLSGLDNDSSRHGICFGLISLLELQSFSKVRSHLFQFCKVPISALVKASSCQTFSILCLSSKCFEFSWRQIYESRLLSILYYLHSNHGKLGSCAELGLWKIWNFWIIQNLVCTRFWLDPARFWLNWTRFGHAVLE